MSFLYFLENIRNPVLDFIFSIVTLCGEETVFMAIGLIVFWCFSKSQGYYLLCTGFIGTVVNQFLKIVCRVPRPWVKDPAFTIVESARADATGYSFPSGHTQSVMASLGCPARFTARKALSYLFCGLRRPTMQTVSFSFATVFDAALSNIEASNCTVSGCWLFSSSSAQPQHTAISTAQKIVFLIIILSFI